MHTSKKVEIVSWKPGYRGARGIQAAVAAKEVLKLQKRCRRKQDLPQRLVKAAESPKHPLHQAFDWDDAKAAHLHRLEQARGMIRSLVITTVRPDGKAEEPVRLLLDTDDGYRPTPEIAAEPVTLAKVLRVIRAQIKAWHRVYASIKGAPKVLKALERVLEELK